MQTDMTKVTVAFRNFADASKNGKKKTEKLISLNELFRLTALVYRKTTTRLSR